MSFEIYFFNKAAKFVKKLDKDTKERLKLSIDKLKTDPVPHDSVRVEGEQKTFRVRVGGYRILYLISFKDRTITIVKIDKRERVY